ncbi:hypothetical protein ACFFIX_06560 [Metabacillus herbersteinensis]|uniref:Uncharacterized protein n=1 Tax=Metabacillus herbersteinensis TaxID=283816 RepID=A0ABV6GBS2_9BACI
MNPSLQDQLKQWEQDHIEVKQQQKKKPPTKKKDKLSDSDLRYLMGTNRQTLHRGRGGALK